MNRRDAVIALFGFCAAPLRAIAQSSRKVARIGLLGVTSAADYALQVEAMRQGFHDLGYVEGQNIFIEYRWVEGRPDRLPVLAAELVSLRPDVIVTSGAGTRVLKEATTTIPIVMAAGPGAVASGLIVSLSQPGGNIMGSTFFGPEISAKRLEMLKEALPRLARVAVPLNPDSRTPRETIEAMKKTATALNVDLIEVPARSPDQFEGAIARALCQRADGLVVLDDSMFVANMRRLGELFAAKNLPGVGSADFAEGGGLLAYGVNFPELWRRVPLFVDKILKGGEAGTIPVERASRFASIINLKSAKALGLMIPQSLMVRADDAIR
jgi:putative ABC transport system substrate-binding protein